MAVQPIQEQPQTQAPAQSGEKPLIRPKKNMFLVAGLVILFLLMAGAIAYLGYQNYQLRQRLTKSSSDVNEATPAPVSTADWTEYSNSKFGFSIKYPPDLSLEPTEIDVPKLSREYDQRCEEGYYEFGCGGGRWPDYQIGFLRQNGKAAFSVNIYQLPMYTDIAVVRDEFSFLVIANRRGLDDLEQEPVDESTLKNIKETLSFIDTDKPLVCLWDLKDGFTEDKLNEYLAENLNPRYTKDSFIEQSGYYYQLQNNKCLLDSRFEWNTQYTTDFFPFKTLEECKATCVE